MNTNDVITWDFLYETELLLKKAIGAKERFVILGEALPKLFHQSNPLTILDGGV